MTDTFQRPPIDLANKHPTTSPRTIPEVIDFNADQNGDRLFCIQATDREDVQGADIQITFRQLRRAIASCSRRLKNIGLANAPRGEKPRAVALFMSSDTTLLVHLFSLLSLGIPAVLLSARLSPLAIRHLVKETAANTVIASSRLQKIVEQALDELVQPREPENIADAAAGAHVAVVTPVSIEQDLVDCLLLPDSAIATPEHFVCESDRNVLILHSSGTTGLPKPIFQSHRYLLGFCTCHIDTHDEDVEALNVSTLPLYHGFGLVAPCLALGIGKPVFLSAGHLIPTGASTVSAIVNRSAKSLTTVPHILEEICRLPRPDGIDMILSLQFVASGGGPLKESVGQQLAQAGVKIISHFGTTEIGPIAPIFVPDLTYDFRFFRVRADYDLQISETYKEDDQQYYQLVAQPFSWKDPFILQDRLITNPQKPGHEFRAVGRLDDLIILATGEKVVPLILETALTEHDLVESAVVFGNDQFELGVLIQPLDLNYDEKALRSDVWSIIEDASQKMDAHARVSSEKAIVLTPRGLSIPRSDKGSILRKEAYQVFSEDILNCYKMLEHESSGKSNLTLRTSDLESQILAIVTEELQLSTQQRCAVDDDLFELGLDSLQAMRIRRTLKAGLASSVGLMQSMELGTDFVYKHPSVRRLSGALRNQDNIDRMTSDFDLATLEDLVQKYALRDEIAEEVILLTGSTGSLGCHILAHVVSLPSVSEVICLLRPSRSDPIQRQLESLKEKGISLSATMQRKMTILDTDTAQPGLGLSGAAYASMSMKLTHIVHAAWPMDFQRDITSFSPQFRTLHNLLRLCQHTHEQRPRIKPRMVFISSIAVVGQYMHHRGSRYVPEIPMVSTSATNNFGYGRAKLVCERIMEEASNNYEESMTCSVVRIGQMSGSRLSGFWNPKEHFPTLMQLSCAAGTLPDLRGTLSWIPVDDAAVAVTDILRAPNSSFMLHLENPMRQSWVEMMEMIGESLKIRPESIVPFENWLEAVRVQSARDEAFQKQSDMLFDFFQNEFKHMSSGDVILETTNSRAISPMLQSIDVVDRETILGYVAWWKASGIL